MGDGLQGEIRDHIRGLQVEELDEVPEGLVQVGFEAVWERCLKEGELKIFNFVADQKEIMNIKNADLVFVN